MTFLSLPDSICVPDNLETEKVSTSRRFSPLDLLRGGKPECWARAELDWPKSTRFDREPDYAW
jgi:hypothetical protein